VYAVVLALAVLPACSRKPIIERVPDSAYKAPSTSAAPTPSPTPTPLRSEAPHQGCVNGWKEPAPGTALRTKPLDLLRKSQGLTGTFQVIDLRYFTGPDDANLAADSKQKTPVERWYGKVVFTKDRSFALRFIAVRRDVGEGIVAIANYLTEDFKSGDWWGFDGEGGKSKYPDVPGRWPGRPYDYAAAHELPDEVVGCLAE
jgi:hypothetical protein